MNPIELYSPATMFMLIVLRRGIVYTDGRAWTAAHHHWLTGHRFDEFGLRVAYDEALETVWALEAPGPAWMRRSPNSPPNLPGPRLSTGWPACAG
ncbi:hypothetical protein OHB35_53080 [Streptomyces phaeochromogenes]|uniref:Uncharacterized protein n=1 Tax=Streptomyces phaeochromogenes TaxID=1923 RepID=A0ABZ1HVI4_STRPH|nr:hypothetical protein [Streptomyces phaeochromogenes]WSD21274.1 hypothetical protein OHB35_53080 [Streptomyces phaeochromogenes]